MTQQAVGDDVDRSGRRDDELGRLDVLDHLGSRDVASEAAVCGEWEHTDHQQGDISTRRFRWTAGPLEQT